MVTHEPTYAIVVTWLDKPATSALNLTSAQTIAALVQINQKFDEYGVNAGDRIRVLVLEESNTRH